MSVYQSSWDTWRWCISVWFQGETLDMRSRVHRILEDSASQFYLQILEKQETRPVKVWCLWAPGSVMQISRQVNVIKTHAVLSRFRKLNKWKQGRIQTTNPDLRTLSEMAPTTKLCKDISKENKTKLQIKKNSWSFFWALLTDDGDAWTISLPLQGKSRWQE